MAAPRCRHRVVAKGAAGVAGDSGDDVRHLQGFNPEVRALLGRRGNRPNGRMPDGAAVSTRQPRYDKACKACGKFGHPEETCAALAMHVWVTPYMKGKLEEEVKLALDNWEKRNEKWIGKGRTISTILTNHIARTKMPIQQVEKEIDW